MAANGLTQFGVGTTTMTNTAAMKMWGAVLVQASATPATASINDQNGNMILPTLTVPATIGASQTFTFNVPVPITVPAAKKTYIDPGGNTVTLAGAVLGYVATVAGAGAQLNLLVK